MKKKRLISCFLVLCMVFGFYACGKDAQVPGITESTEIVDKFAVGEVTPVKYGSAADIYLPETAVVNPPTVVQTITSQTGFPDSDRPCAVAILHIDAQMNVVEGDRVLTTVDTFLALYRDRVIPAFYIDSDGEAEALMAYLEDKDLSDAYVMAHSSQAELVYKVRSDYRRVQGALWFDGISDENARREALLLTNRSLAMVICSAQPLSAEDMLYFNARLVSAWCCAEDSADVYGGIAKGYNGVISADSNTVYDVYASLKGTPTVCGQAIVIGHRGTYTYLENTLASFRRAQEEYHCNAVEMDLRLSASGEIVLMHDATVDRTTNGTGKVAELTTKQLKDLQVIKGGDGDIDTIPTFEEVLQTFAGTDLVLVCHINVLKEAMAKRFNELVEQYACQDQVIAFVGFNGRTTHNYTNYTPGIAFASGTEDSLLLSDDPLRVVDTFVRNLVTFHSQPLFYDYIPDDSDISHANPAFYYQMSARGFLNWHSTTTGEEKTESTLLVDLGAAAALLNQPQTALNYHYYIDARDVSLDPGQAVPLTHTAVGQKGNTELTCEYWQIDGPELSGGTLDSAGSVTVVYYACLNTDSGRTYRIISEPVTITFGA